MLEEESSESSESEAETDSDSEDMITNIPQPQAKNTERNAPREVPEEPKTLEEPNDPKDPAAREFLIDVNGNHLHEAKIFPEDEGEDEKPLGVVERLVADFEKYAGPFKMIMPDFQSIEPEPPKQVDVVADKPVS